MTQFIAFHVDDSRADGVPIAAAFDLELARGQAIRRVLGLGITHGAIAVQSDFELSPEEFGDLRRMLDDYFAERLPEVLRG